MSKAKLRAIIFSAVLFGFLTGRMNFSGGMDQLDPVFSRFKPLQEFMQRTFGSREIASVDPVVLAPTPSKENKELKKELEKLGFHSDFRKTKKGKTVLKIEPPKIIGVKTPETNDGLSDDVDWMVSGAPEEMQPTLAPQEENEKRTDLNNDYKN